MALWSCWGRRTSFISTLSTWTPQGSVATSRLWCMASAMFSRSDKISDKFLVPRMFLNHDVKEFHFLSDLSPESGLSQESSWSVIVVVVTNGAQRIGNLGVMIRRIFIKKMLTSPDSRPQHQHWWWHCLWSVSPGEEHQMLQFSDQHTWAGSVKWLLKLLLTCSCQCRGWSPSYQVLVLPQTSVYQVWKCTFQAQFFLLTERNSGFWRRKNVTWRWQLSHTPWQSWSIPRWWRGRWWWWAGRRGWQSAPPWSLALHPDHHRQYHRWLQSVCCHLLHLLLLHWHVDDVVSTPSGHCQLWRQPWCSPESQHSM